MNKTIIFLALVGLLICSTYAVSAATGTSSSSTLAQTTSKLSSKATGKEALKAKTRAQFTKPVPSPVLKKNVTVQSGPKYYIKGGARTKALPEAYQKKKRFGGRS